MDADLRPNKRSRPWLRAAGTGLLALAGCITVASHMRPAHAWVCTRVADNYGDPSGPALAWPSRTVPFSFNKDGTGKIDNGDAQTAILAAFNSWSSSILRDNQPQACKGLVDTSVITATTTDITFAQGADTTQSSVGYDYLEPDNNENVIVFRDDSWRYPLSGPPADIIAMTTLTYNVITGDILDADIEFNTKYFEFTTTDSGVVYDLQNTAAHEVGHMLGFAHSLDQNATMYSSANKGETTKRTLSCDDASILWYRYPAGADTQSCQLGEVNDACGQCAHKGGLAYSANLKIIETHDGQGGCTCQSIDAGGAMGLAALGLLTVDRLRRSRRRGVRL